MDSNLRVRLVFEDEHILSKSQRSQGLQQSWLLVKPNQHPNFSQLSDHLLHLFGLHQSCPHGLVLSMDGFVLPPFESTCFLKDKEIISVKKKGRKSSNVVKVADKNGSADELEIVKGVELLANEEFNKESGGYQSDSEDDEDANAVENTLGGNALSKKRKASEGLVGSTTKKHKVAVPDGAKKDHRTNKNKGRHDDGVLVRKSHHKKEKSSKTKTKPDTENISESTESSSSDESSKSVKSDQLEENDKENKDTSPAPTKKLPSRSARRKKAKRQWLRAMAKIGKKEEVCDTKRPVGDIRRPLKQKERRPRTEKKEVISQSKGLLHWKQSHEGYNKYKKEDSAPVLARPGHIRFDPLDEDEAVPESQVSMENFQWNGITSKKQGQKWGIEKISSTQRNDHTNNDGDHSDTHNIVKDIVISSTIEFNELPPLPGNMPKEGHVIAYRLLELSSSWTPEPSEFRVGRVLWYKPESKSIMLAPVPEYPVVLEKLDGDEPASQQDIPLYKEDGSLEIDFRSLIDVRIVKIDETNSGKDATVKVGGGPVGNENATSSLSEDKQKQIPDKGDGEVNLWDHFTEDSNTKKIELSEDNGWSTWTEGASRKNAPSYRAWRGSALGPTMSRLRSKQGK
ncbi:coilin [Daucus carota subsp. sativus]|uniref:coilin n=1 Tax=Daucus carota subsp. sativus TaxID=79200 RepID=UPI0007EF12BD|nr:PREDICTED: coilin [Daucus carota subsp. sativus]